MLTSIKPDARTIVTGRKRRASARVSPGSSPPRAPRSWWWPADLGRCQGDGAEEIRAAGGTAEHHLCDVS